MTTITATEAKAHFLDIIRKADRTMQHFVISKNGKPKAVIMSVDEYDGWLETIEIMSDKKAMKEIQDARQELKQGKGHSFEEVFKPSRIKR